MKTQRTEDVLKNGDVNFVRYTAHSNFEYCFSFEKDKQENGNKQCCVWRSRAKKHHQDNSNNLNPDGKNSQFITSVATPDGRTDAVTGANYNGTNEMFPLSPPLTQIQSASASAQIVLPAVPQTSGLDSDGLPSTLGVAGAVQGEGGQEQEQELAIDGEGSGDGIHVKQMSDDGLAALAYAQQNLNMTPGGVTAGGSGVVTVSGVSVSPPRQVEGGGVGAGGAGGQDNQGPRRFFYMYNE